jgi:hypothetical protein
LLKPVVPLSPVTIMDIVVELVEWFVVIVALDIWVLVMFPLIARLTVATLSILAFTNVSSGVGEGDGFAVGVGVAFGVLVVVGVEVGLGSDVGKGVGVVVGSDVGVGAGEGVGEGTGVEVGVIVKVNELLIPEYIESLAVMVTAEPAPVIVIVVDPTPPTKAFIVLELIVPDETVKDGLPVYPVTVFPYASLAVTVILKPEPEV